VRLGLRSVTGLREEIGRRIEAARRAAPFSSLADLASRGGADEGTLSRLAEIGALGALGGTRRAALWQVEALGRSGELFLSGTLRGFPNPPATGFESTPRGQTRVGAPGEQSPPSPTRSPFAESPLPEMTAEEELSADYAGTSLTIGPHPVSFSRAALDRQGITRAADLAAVPQGRRARVAGVVIVRQRPGTAKGFVFITLEDETGFANAIVTPDLFERHRQVILGVSALVIEGVVQNQDGVVSLKADRFEPLGGRSSAIDVSHDFH